MSFTSSMIPPEAIDFDACAAGDTRRLRGDVIRADMDVTQKSNPILGQEQCWAGWLIPRWTRPWNPRSRKPRPGYLRVYVLLRSSRPSASFLADRLDDRAW